MEADMELNATIYDEASDLDVFQVGGFVMGRFYKLKARAFLVVYTDKDSIFVDGQIPVQLGGVTLVVAVILPMLIGAADGGMHDVVCRSDGDAVEQIVTLVLGLAVDAARRLGTR